jgi:hypothetical protein
VEGVTEEERGLRVCKELEEEEEAKAVAEVVVERFARLEEDMLGGKVEMPQREGMLEVEWLFVGMRAGMMLEEE